MPASLPDNVSAASMKTAVETFRKVVGEDWLFGPGHERLASYDDAMPIDDPGRYAPYAAVAPADVEQVRAILAVANQYRVPLWTFSTGRNFGYGGAAPRVAGSVVVDLARMNRIIEVNEEFAYCVVEPGVTYFQLHEYLQSKKLNLWLSPPEPGWASVMGNALDHGVGYTPIGDNFGFSCGMEVVLADGDVVRTGMGAMSRSNTWQLFKYGFGPTVDGLFGQSNLGIVTKMGMWLMPAPPAYRSYMITFPRESDLHQVVEIMRPLKISQIFQNAGMIVPWSYEACVTAPRSAFWSGTGPLPEADKQNLIDKLDIGYWNIYGAQYGTPGSIAEQWAIIKSAFSQVPGARFYFAEDRPELVGLQMRNLLAKGVPNMGTFNLLNWVPNAAHVGLSPISPTTGDDATRLYALLKGEAESAGCDYIGGFVVGWRELHNILMFIYDKSDSDARNRVRNTVSRLISKTASMGYGDYRTHIAFMDDVAQSYDFNNHALLRMTERIKDALDPNGILSAGKSGIWPKAMRKKRG